MARKESRRRSPRGPQSPSQSLDMHLSPPRLRSHLQKSQHRCLPVQSPQTSNVTGTEVSLVEHRPNSAGAWRVRAPAASARTRTRAPWLSSMHVTSAWAWPGPARWSSKCDRAPSSRCGACSRRCEAQVWGGRRVWGQGPIVDLVYP